MMFFDPLLRRTGDVRDAKPKNLVVLTNVFSYDRLYL